MGLLNTTTTHLYFHYSSYMGEWTVGRKIHANSRVIQVYQQEQNVKDKW